MQNKDKVVQLMIETKKQHQFHLNLLQKLGETAYNRRRKDVRRSLKEKYCLFQTTRLEKKVNNFEEGFNKPHRPTQAETQTGFYVTPLVQGEVQFRKMKKMRM